VVWGAFHGLLIAVTQAVRKVSALSAFHEKPSRRARLVTWAVTFYLVLIGWVLFRAPTLGAAFGMLGSMHGLGPELPAAGDKALVVLQLVLAALVLMHGLDFLVLRYRRKPAPERRPGRLQAFLRWSRAFGFWFLLVFGQALCLLIGKPSNEFIYFQF
jgi:uncharacterized protein YhhL (DUF1145 family)